MNDFDLQRLARIVESSDDAIVSKDTNGIILSWNSAAERMFGYTAAEAIGKSIRMIIPADRQSEEDFVLGQIRSGKPVRHYETIRQHKDGHLIPISLTVSPLYGSDGKVVGASKIARDISVRKTAGLLEQRLAAVVSSSDDAIITKDLNGIITSWNRAAERMFGFTAGEAIGKSIRIVIPADLQSEEDNVLARIRNGLSVDHYETRRVRKDGREILISLTVSPIIDDAGIVIGASKIARDITEAVRMRNLAQEQATIMRQLSEFGVRISSTLERDTIAQKVIDIATELTSAQCGAFFYSVIDPQRGESYMLQSLSGASKEEFAKFPPPRDGEMLGSALRAEKTIRLSDVTEDAVFGKNSPFHAVLADPLPIRSYMAVPVKAASGEVLGGLFFGHAQAGVFTPQHEQLANGIAAWATIALENAQLYLSVREADRIKDEFLAVLSHELRTPLAAILGYARLLRGGLIKDEKIDHAHEVVERNAVALNQIVDDVLDISRIVSGKVRLDVQPVELPVVVHNAVATVQPAADSKAVRLQTIIDPRVGPVSGDPGRLQQVVWNLLSNAVKFTPKNGRVQVCLERVNSHIEIVVSDSGIGIRPDFLPFVFERFRQADSSLTRKTGGLGLGLSIVKNIVEMHGGTVQAESQGEGQGATFRVRLPLMIVQTETTPRPQREHPRAETMRRLKTLTDLSGIRVLAIDDEADSLKLLSTVLESAGAEVATMRSAQNALDKMEQIHPDVLVVDLGMPEMDGFEFIRHLRGSSQANICDIPAAALTAFARSEDRTKALQSGFEIHLAKPVDPGELAASVATLARRNRRR
jgi:PAS domain S-box-containing protein